MDTTNTHTTTDRLTFEDVAHAVATLGAPPSALSAQAVRRALGRGSYSTIQKHLDILRTQERAEREDQDDDEKAPDVPRAVREAADALWTTAYAQAELAHYKKWARAEDRIAALEAQVSALMADRDAAMESAEDAEERAAKEVAARAEADAEKARAQEAEAHAKKELEEKCNEIEKLRLQYTAAIGALRGEQDRLTSQLADYRAALGKKAG
jgi:chromosome segregation ATPase